MGLTKNVCGLLLRAEELAGRDCLKLMIHSKGERQRKAEKNVAITDVE